MGECTCHENYNLDTLIPKVGIITDIRQETPDVKTFRVNAPEGGKLFEHMPGQCAMLCGPGVGEAMFSITSSPTNKEFQEFSIKKCGVLTDYLHSLEVGDQITVRGPYGNNFPVEEDLKGKNLLFIAGGIGLAPLRSVINYVLDNRDNYGTVDILYGSRSADDLVQLDEIQNCSSICSRISKIHSIIIIITANVQKYSHRCALREVGFLNNFLIRFTSAPRER